MEGEPVNLREFEEIAKGILPKSYFDYYESGANDERTLQENIEAFKRITLRPRILLDVSKIDMSITLLGHKLQSPIIVAPTGFHKFAHPEGEVVTARAAAACNTLMVLSFSSTRKLEDVAASCNYIRFYQLYVLKNRQVTEALLRKVERYGFKAIVLTVDTPRRGRREKDIKNKLVLPRLPNLDGLMNVNPNEAFPSQNFDPSLCWKDIEWLKSVTSLPIILKGILTAEDAVRAVEIGVSGIVVSNHGARQLDFAPATISVLEEVAKAVSGAVPVLIDGGIRRGTDVFKALALGAKAVMVGRPILYGLTAKGGKGVESVIKMLQGELELAMALCGTPSVGEITRKHVQTEVDRLRSLL